MLVSCICNVMNVIHSASVIVVLFLWSGIPRHRKSSRSYWDVTMLFIASLSESWEQKAVWLAGSMSVPGGLSVHGTRWVSNRTVPPCKGSVTWTMVSTPPCCCWMTFPAPAACPAPTACPAHAACPTPTAAATTVTTAWACGDGGGILTMFEMACLANHCASSSSDFFAFCASHLAVQSEGIHWMCNLKASTESKVVVFINDDFTSTMWSGHTTKLEWCINWLLYHWYKLIAYMLQSLFV